ncbi:MAG: hypothetical protein M3Q31_21645 [Actinomycetota bacterium]|nr:hypothetical protein [Actinomycetota bacterium]
MGAPILASTMFGTPVEIDGASERLIDLGVVRAADSWRVAAVRTRLGDAAFTRWEAGRISATATGGDVEATWLREALFDRQIVDLEGHRVIRVGDVVLRADAGRLEVVALDVGAAAVLRRLGLSRLAARFAPQLLPIDRLHLASTVAGGLLLDAPRARLEELEPETVTGLLSRLPVPAAEHAVRQSRHRDAVARGDQLRRRRHRYPRLRR